MKLYHASMDLRTLRKFHDLFPHKYLNVLRSFGMLDHQVYDICTKYREIIGGLILDSGTWTLNNASTSSSRHITLENYGSYLEVVEKFFNYYFNFDSNFTEEGSEENDKNQIWLEKRGRTPVPVVHQIDGDEIQTFIRRGYDRVALGSSQIKNETTLGKVMGQFEGTGIKIHLFGQTKFELLAHFPIDSCDTAMWAREGGWGNIRYWNEKRDKENKTDLIYLDEYLREEIEKGYSFSTYEYREDLERFLSETFGITYYHLIGNDGPFYKRLVNTYYFVKLEEIVNQIHTERGFKKSK